LAFCFYLQLLSKTRQQFQAGRYKIPHLQQYLFVGGTSRFRPAKFVKEVFCAKKAKTRNAFNKRFGKKPADGRLNQLLFRYFASVSAEGSKFSR